jgi:thioredoxin reductase
VRLFEEQAQYASVQVAFDRVRSLTYDGETFRVDTPDRVYNSQVVVIATGTRPMVFTDFPVPASLQERVYYEVYPLLGVVGKQIAIIGAGDAAFDYALNLARKNTLLILNRSDQVKCLPLLWERAASTPRITYHAKTAVSGLVEAPEGGIALECTGSSGTIRFQVDYLVGALGRDPCVDFISSELFERAPELERRGVLYWIGDVRNGIYRQTAIAVGDGIRAAMHIYRHFEENAP